MKKVINVRIKLSYIYTPIINYIFAFLPEDFHKKKYIITEDIKFWRKKKLLQNAQFFKKTADHTELRKIFT